MTKRLTLIVLSLLVFFSMSLTLVACGKDDEPIHTHTFATEWSRDEIYHWHQATCEHTTLEKDREEHKYVEGVCKCGKTEPHVHNFNLEKVEAQYLANDADCIHYATYYKSCECGAKGTETFEYEEGGYGEHIHIESKGRVAPTCHTFGYDAGEYCTDCQQYISGHGQIAMTLHSWIVDTKNSKEANCTEAGVKAYKCSCEGCEATKTEVGEPAKNHSVSSWTETSKVKVDGTSKCEYTVTYEGICSNCHETISKTEILEYHSFYWSITKEPTCQADGEKTEYCLDENCKWHTTAHATEKYALPEGADGHDWKVDTLNENKYICSHCSAEKIIASSTENTLSGSNLTTVDEIQLSTASVSMNDAMKSSLNGAELSITAEEKNKDDVLASVNNEADKEKISKAKAVFDFTLIKDGVTQSDLGGEITIRIPYTLQSGDDPAKISVACIKDDGTIESFPAVYANKQITFTTNHFSIYSVVELTPSEYCAKYNCHENEYIRANPDKFNVIAPTCTLGGYTVCLHCGEIFNATDPLGHSWVTKTESTASCTENGTERHECSVCGIAYNTYTPAIGHNYLIESEVKATCTSTGSITYKCSHCDDEYTITTAKLNHNYIVETVEPTCTENGYTKKVCHTCGAEIYTNVVDPLDHNFGNVWVKSNEGHYHVCESCGEIDEIHSHIPGAEATEITAQICTECGYIIEPALGHVCKSHLIKVNAVNADCLNNGNIEYYVCDCGKWYLDENAQQLITDHLSVVINALGHDIENRSAIEPSCTEVGYTAGVWCSRCEKYVSGHIEIPATGHIYTAVVTKPTCEKGGYTTYTCSCGHSYDGNKTEKLGHNYVDEIIAPTCTENGYTKHTCINCGATSNINEVNALGHAWKSEFESDENYHWHVCSRCDALSEKEAHVSDYDEATIEHGITCTVCGYEIAPILEHTHAGIKHDAVSATCTSNGNLEYYVCSCGNWFYDENCTEKVVDKSTLIISALGHSKTFVPELKATCCAIGYSDGYYCSRCEKWLSGHETLAIDPNNHDIISHEGKAATCTEKGYKAYETCNRCEYSTYEEIPAFGHDYVFNRIEWTDFTAKAIYVCSHDASHVEEYDCEVSSAITTLPTCSATGIKTYTATYDGHTSTKEETLAIDPQNHDIISHEGKAATCTEKGYNAYETCSRCEYSTYEEIPAFGHDYVFNRIEWTDFTAKAIYTCSHNASHTEEYDCEVSSAITTLPTCTATGIKTYTATYDGHTSTKEETLAIDPQNHDIISHAGKDATCTEKGYKAYETCNRCEYSTYEEIPAFGHDYVFNRIEWTDFTAKAIYVCSHDANHIEEYDCEVSSAITTLPTCSATGIKTYTATYDGHTSTKEEVLVIDSNNHDIISHEGKNATCTEKGYNAYETCNRCEYSTYEEIPAFGHDVSKMWSSDNNYHWHTCSRCEEQLDKTEHASDYDEATSEHGIHCLVCGYEITKQLEEPTESDEQEFINAFDPSNFENVTIDNPMGKQMFDYPNGLVFIDAKTYPSFQIMLYNGNWYIKENGEWAKAQESDYIGFTYEKMVDSFETYKTFDHYYKDGAWIVNMFGSMEVAFYIENDKIAYQSTMSEKDTHFYDYGTTVIVVPQDLLDFIEKQGETPEKTEFDKAFDSSNFANFTIDNPMGKQMFDYPNGLVFVENYSEYRPYVLMLYNGNWYIKENGNWAMASEKDYISFVYENTVNMMTELGKKPHRFDNGAWYVNVGGRELPFYIENGKLVYQTTMSEKDTHFYDYGTTVIDVPKDLIDFIEKQGDEPEKEVVYTFKLQGENVVFYSDGTCCAQGQDKINHWRIDGELLIIEVNDEDSPWLNVPFKIEDDCITPYLAEDETPLYMYVEQEQMSSTMVYTYVVKFLLDGKALVIYYYGDELGLWTLCNYVKEDNILIVEAPDGSTEKLLINEDGSLSKYQEPEKKVQYSISFNYNGIYYEIEFYNDYSLTAEISRLGSYLDTQYSTWEFVDDKVVANLKSGEFSFEIKDGELVFIDPTEHGDISEENLCYYTSFTYDGITYQGEFFRPSTVVFELYKNGEFIRQIITDFAYTIGDDKDMIVVEVNEHLFYFDFVDRYSEEVSELTFINPDDEEIDLSDCVYGGILKVMGMTIIIKCYEGGEGLATMMGDPAPYTNWTIDDKGIVTVDIAGTIFYFTVSEKDGKTLIEYVQEDDREPVYIAYYYDMPINLYEDKTCLVSMGGGADMPGSWYQIDDNKFIVVLDGEELPFKLNEEDGTLSYYEGMDFYQFRLVVIDSYGKVLFTQPFELDEKNSIKLEVNVETLVLRVVVEYSFDGETFKERMSCDGIYVPGLYVLSFATHGMGGSMGFNLKNSEEYVRLVPVYTVTCDIEGQGKIFNGKFEFFDNGAFTLIGERNQTTEILTHGRYEKNGELFICYFLKDSEGERFFGKDSITVVMGETEEKEIQYTANFYWRELDFEIKFYNDFTFDLKGKRGEKVVANERANWEYIEKKVLAYFNGEPLLFDVKGDELFFINPEQDKEFVRYDYSLYPDGGELTFYLGSTRNDVVEVIKNTRFHYVKSGITKNDEWWTLEEKSVTLSENNIGDISRIDFNTIDSFEFPIIYDGMNFSFYAEIIPDLRNASAVETFIYKEKYITLYDNGYASYHYENEGYYNYCAYEKATNGNDELVKINFYGLSVYIKKTSELKDGYIIYVDYLHENKDFIQYRLFLAASGLEIRLYVFDDRFCEYYSNEPENIEYFGYQGTVDVVLSEDKTKITFMGSTYTIDENNMLIITLPDDEPEFDIIYMGVVNFKLYDDRSMFYVMDGVVVMQGLWNMIDEKTINISLEGNIVFYKWEIDNNWYPNEEPDFESAKIINCTKPGEDTQYVLYLFSNGRSYLYDGTLFLDCYYNKSINVISISGLYSEYYYLCNGVLLPATYYEVVNGVDGVAYLIESKNIALINLGKLTNNNIEILNYSINGNEITFTNGVFSVTYVIEGRKIFYVPGEIEKPHGQDDEYVIDNYVFYVSKNGDKSKIILETINAFVSENKNTIISIVDNYEKVKDSLELPDLSDNKSGTLTVITNAEFEPFEYYENGELAGVDVFIMSCIAEMLDMKIEWIDVDFDMLITILQPKENAVVASAIPYREEFAQYAYASSVYYIDEYFMN